VRCTSQLAQQSARRQQAREAQANTLFRARYKEQQMTRTVVFDGDKAAKRFEMVVTAVQNAGDGKAERSRERVRREARILDALDMVSEPKTTDAPDGLRELKPLPQTLVLDQADHKLVEDYLNTTPWLPRAARAAVDVQDFWESAQKNDEK
jgi:hypothetical protein